MRCLNLDPEAIAILLARRGMLRKEMCKLAGITDANFSSMLKKGHATPILVGRIAKALDVDVTDIIIRESETQEERRACND